MSKEPTRYTDEEKAKRRVDPATCHPTTTDKAFVADLNRRGQLLNSAGKAKADDLSQWTRLQFTLFSMMAAPRLPPPNRVRTAVGGGGAGRGEAVLDLRQPAARA